MYNCRVGLIRSSPNSAAGMGNTVDQMMAAMGMSSGSGEGGGYSTVGVSPASSARNVRRRKSVRRLAARKRRARELPSQEQSPYGANPDAPVRLGVHRLLSPAA